MAKLNENLEGAKKRQETRQRVLKERLQEQEEKHLQEMARIEENDEKAKVAIEKEITEFKKKLEEEEQEYKKRRTEVGTELAKQADQAVSEAFASTAMASVEATGTAGGIVTIAQALTKKQELLDVSEQFQLSQIQNVVATMAELFQELKKDMIKQIRKI